MSNRLFKLGVLGASALTFTLLATQASAQDTVRWKMQSAFGSSLPHLGPGGIRFSKDIERLSGGKFDVKFFEPGALIPPLECFDSVSKGAIEACWTTPGYHTGKYPEAAFFTAVPFGPGIGEFLAWKWNGGGNKLRDEVYAKHGMIAVDAYCIGPETSGWFRKEVKSLKELKGMKMRFFGLGAQVMQKLYPRMQRRDFAPQGYTRQLLKDLEMVHEYAAGLKAPTPMMGEALSLYRILVHLGHAELDTGAILKIYDRTGSAAGGP